MWHNQDRSGTSHGHGQRWLSRIERSASRVAFAAGAAIVLLLGLHDL